MVTHELVLQVIYDLNQHKANTSLAMIGCILKGDTNSICSAYQHFDKFGTMDEKSLKNMGAIFDDLIDKKLILIIDYGLQKKYEISKRGLELINNEDPEDNDKYYESNGAPSDYLEENQKLDNIISKINDEIKDIKDNRYFKDVKPSSVGSDIEEIEDIALKKRMNASYEEQINELNIIKSNPYFARMDLLRKSGSIFDVVQLYIGNRSHTFNDNDLILDWRNEIAEFYYSPFHKFQLKSFTYEVELKRQIEIENSRIKFIYNQLTKRKSELKDTISDPFLINVLKKKKDSIGFTNIISTIQQKQNEIIRLPLDANVLVQGCAGSGKTMILMHRLSYLLYHNKKLNTDFIKIITPNDLFDRFIQDLSNELQLDNVERLSMLQLYINHINKHFIIKKSFNYKSEDDINDDVLKILYSQQFIDSVVSKIKEAISKDLNFIYEKNKRDIETRFSNYLNIKKNIAELNQNLCLEIRIISEKVQNDESLNRFMNIDNIHELPIELDKIININVNIESKINQLKQDINNEKIKLKSIDEILNPNFINTIVDQSKAYRIKLFSSNKGSVYEYLINYKNSATNVSSLKLMNLEKEIKKIESLKIDEDTYKLYKEVQKIYFKKIEPLIVTIEKEREKLAKHSDDEFLYDKLMEELNELTQEIESYLTNYGGNNRYIEEIINKLTDAFEEKIDLNSHFDTIIEEEISLVHSAFQSKVRFHNQYKYYYFLKLAVLNEFNFNFEPLNLLMIDEAQEYSIEELQLIKSIHPLININIYGDVNQLTSSIGSSNWDSIKSGFKYYELNENYRNPRPIVNYINDQLNMIMVSLGLDEGLIETNKFDENERIDAIIMNEDDKNKFIHDHEINDNLIDKIYHIDEVKGLEFNSVIVFEKGMNHNQKYISLSRALEKLYVID